MQQGNNGITDWKICLKICKLPGPSHLLLVSHHREEESHVILLVFARQDPLKESLSRLQSHPVDTAKGGDDLLLRQQGQVAAEGEGGPGLALAFAAFSPACMGCPCMGCQGMTWLVRVALVTVGCMGAEPT